MKIYFDHEKLDVYREAINFCACVGKVLREDEAAYPSSIEHEHD